MIIHYKNYANNLLKELPRTAATEHLIHTERNGEIRTEAYWNSAECANKELPSQLKTAEALNYFQKAQELGLIDKQYKWLKGMQLLACFARDMSLKLKLGKGTNSDKMERINWRIFEDLFGISHGKLRSNYNDIQKTGQNPTDIDLVVKVSK